MKFAKFDAFHISCIILNLSGRGKVEGRKDRRILGKMKEDEVEEVEGTQAG
jgi:hypothetical protein